MKGTQYGPQYIQLPTMHPPNGMSITRFFPGFPLHVPFSLPFDIRSQNIAQCGIVNRVCIFLSISSCSECYLSEGLPGPSDAMVLAIATQVLS